MKLVEERRAVINYVRNPKKRPVGVVVVYKTNAGQLKVGYSKCHPKDSYNKTVGLHTALQRAIPIKDQEEIGYDRLPTGFDVVMQTTIDRAKKYFRNKLQDGLVGDRRQQGKRKNPLSIRRTSSCV